MRAFGSCDLRLACIEYVNPAETTELSALRESCVAREGNWSTKHCPRHNAFGACFIQDSILTFSYWPERSFSPLAVDSVEEARKNCSTSRFFEPNVATAPPR